MTGSGKTLYPMLGVGAFFVMFWTGFVVGYELGLSCGWFLLNALFFGCAGCYFVVRLEAADACPRPPREFEDRANGRSARLPLPMFPLPFTSRTR